jgi:hypothetical protein
MSQPNRVIRDYVTTRDSIIASEYHSVQTNETRNYCHNHVCVALALSSRGQTLWQGKGRKYLLGLHHIGSFPVTFLNSFSHLLVQRLHPGIWSRVLLPATSNSFGRR